MAGRDVEFGVVGAEVFGDRACVDGLVEAGLVKADGKGAHGAGRLRLHHGHHRGGVDAAGQKGAERDIGVHAQPDRVAQQRLQGVDGAVFAALKRAGQPLFRRSAGAPVDLYVRHPLAGLQRRVGTGFEFANAPVDGIGAWDVAQAQIGRQGVAIEFAPPARMGGQGLEFGAEQEATAVVAVVEGFFAESVAGQRQATLGPVPEREGEHAVEFAQGRRDAMPTDPGEQHLGVGVAAPGRRVVQAVAQGLVVVDLAVEGEDVTPARGQHWLMPARGQIEDR